MTEGGRPWWNTSAVGNSRLPLSSLVTQQTPPKHSIMSPVPNAVPIIKTEPLNRSYPSFSPSCLPADCSIVKSEPLSHIKSEPLAYLERALVKGEFPSEFNWPYIKWEPLPGTSGVNISSVKKEEKHYIPDPCRKSVFNRLDNKFNPIPPRTDRPPPNWQYIYSREIYEPTGSAKEWWNETVERALKNRRVAYLLTKQNDKVPIEVRMERLWNFEVAKDEARRVIAESKWKAASGHDSVSKDNNGVNYGASTSAECSKDNNNVGTNHRLSVKDRIGQFATVSEDLPCVQKTSDSPVKDHLGQLNTDEVKIIPRHRENAEVYTIDDEIEDTISNSDDGNDISVVCEGSSDIIFIQKKQGEVTFIAQVEGRLVKMNRKRKLCVTVVNNAKRSKVVTVDIEQSSVKDNDGEDEDISVISEQRKNSFLNKVQTNNTGKGEQTDSPAKNSQSGRVESEKELIDINSEVESENEVLGVIGTDVQDSNVDVDVQIHNVSRSEAEEKDKCMDEDSDSVKMLDEETSQNDKDSHCSSINILEEHQVIDASVTGENDIVVEATEGRGALQETTKEREDLTPIDMVEDIDQNDVLIVDCSEDEVSLIEGYKEDFDVSEAVTPSAEEFVDDAPESFNDVPEAVEESMDVVESVDDVESVDVVESVEYVAEDITVLESDETNGSIQETEKWSTLTGKRELIDWKDEEDVDISKEEIDISESNAQKEVPEPEEEEVLLINLQESEEETLDELQNSDGSMCSPQKKDTGIKDLQKDDNISQENVEVASTDDEEIEVLEATITTTPRVKDRVTRLGSRLNQGNNPSSVEKQTNVNTRQTRQSRIGNTSARITRQRMPAKTSPMSGTHNTSNLKMKDVNQNSPKNGNGEKREATQKGSKTPTPQAPSTYSFRNRSKKF